MLEVTAVLILLHGPQGHSILINPATVASMTGPRDHEHLVGHVKCLVNTTDGKRVATTETCDQVRALIDHPQ